MKCGRGTLRFLGYAAVLLSLAHPAFSQLVIFPTSLSDGIVGQSYSGFISASNINNTNPITLSLLSGTPPPGVSFTPSGSTASLIGTPTAIGNYTFTVQATQPLIGSGTLITNQTYTIQIAGVLTVTTSSLAQATVGSTYQQQLAATGGIPPYTWFLGTFESGSFGTASVGRSGHGRLRPTATTSGGLPPGLTLSTSGQIAGMPTTAGSYTFDVTVSDSSSSDPQSTGGTFTIVVNSVSPLLITTTSPLRAGTVGTPYSIPLRAQGGEIPYTWTLASGTIPPGLLLGGAGSLTGTPTEAGNYSFTLMVTDSTGLTATTTFTIVIAGSFAITTSSPLTAGAVGMAYSTPINVTPTTGPYTFSVAGSGTLPAGLSLSPSSTAPAGTLSGTPTAAGSFTFTIVASDSANHTASQSFTLVIGPAPITITPATLLSGTLDTAYSQQLTATGGAGGYAFSLGSGGLPDGITIGSAGLLSGTPTATGTFSFTVNVTDSKQTTVTQAFQLIIGAPTVSSPTVTGVGSTAPPAQQPTISVELAQAYPTDLTGTVTLNFTSAVGNVDDPSIQFSTGGRTVTFRIPAGQTTAVFPAATVSIGTGTVAGTITLTMHFLGPDGQDVTPAPTPMQTITIAPEAPAITKVTVSTTSGGIEVDVTGFSNTRQMVSATFTFQAASGTTLQGSTATITVGQIFSGWYVSAASDPYGSQFTFAQPFTISGSTSGIASVSVTLTNEQGTSTSVSATFP